MRGKGGEEGTGSRATARAPARWARALARELGEDLVTTDPAELGLYDRDAAPLPASASWAFRQVPDAVVCPRSAEDVARAVRFASEHGVPVVPRGGATWGFGGAVPTNGGIVFDLRSLCDMSVDADAMAATSGAGAVWRDVIATAEARGLLLPSYPSSAPGSTVGGWVNTGGVGIGSYRYGGAERLVRSLGVVLPSGERARLGFDRVVQNSSGYDLRALVIGSEGTLCVVVDATLELVPLPEAMRHVAATFPSTREMGAFLQKLARSRLVPYHVSFVDGSHLRNLGAMGGDVPAADGGLVNLSFEGYRAVVDWEAEAAASLARAAGGRVEPEALARGRWDDRLFDLRVAAEGPTLLMSDVFVPLGRAHEAMQAVGAVLRAHAVRGGVVGTAASRSTATLMPYVLVDRRQWETFFAYGLVDEFSAVALELGGRPAGVGLWGAHHMPRMHGAALDAMAEVKRALDPQGIMNPGKLLHAVSRFDVELPAAVMDLGTRSITLVHGLIGGGAAGRAGDGVKWYGVGGVGMKEGDAKESDAGEGDG